MPLEGDIVEDIPMIDEGEKVVDIISGPGINVFQITPGVFLIEADDSESGVLTFSWYLLGASIVVRAGTIFIGETAYAIAETTLNLTGATEYVYIWHKVDHSSSGISSSATDPGSGDSSEYRWRIVKLEAVAVGKYRWAAEYRPGGDVVVQVPIR